MIWAQKKDCIFRSEEQSGNAIKGMTERFLGMFSNVIVISIVSKKAEHVVNLRKCYFEKMLQLSPLET